MLFDRLTERNAVEKQRMPLLALEYPNGQIYEVESHEDFAIGQVFEMYGRRWRVVGPSMQDGSRRYGKRAGSRLVCQLQP